jgi:hypothetical protein
MQNSAGDAEPIFVNRFPLTTGPQHVPDTVQCRPIIGWWATPTRFLQRLRKQFPDPFPQRLGYLKVVDIPGFFAMIFHCGVLVE